MDELFSKAAEHYPLKTDTADWEALQAKLAAAPDGTAAVALPVKTRRRYFWWLLLLLLVPLPFLLTRSVEKNSQASLPQQQQADGQRADGNDNASLDQLAPAQRKALAEHQSPAEESAANPARVREPRQTTGQPEPSSAASRRMTPKAGADRTVLIGADHPVSNGRTNEGISKIGGHEKRSAFEHYKTERNSLPADRKAALRNPENDGPSAYPAAQPLADPGMAIGDRQALISAPLSPKPPFSVLPRHDSAAASFTKKRQTASTPIGAYLGVVVGPDLSTVKSQAGSNPGYSAGMLAGYRLDRHWALEASVLWSKKNYYTAGKYFDKTRSGIPAAVTVTELNGACQMFELPLLLRYHFQWGQQSFFVSGGLTSYLMKKEEYAYAAYGGGGYYEGHHSYKNSGNHFFSNAQLSVGYELRLAPRSMLRIEPYYKLPLRDVGIGNLPITSAGLYIGLTHSLHSVKN